MSNFDKTVTLLSLTDGRDKLSKSLLGVFRVLAAVAAAHGDSHAKGYNDIVVTIRNARSLLRMGKFVADFTKLMALLRLFSAQGVTHTENKKFIEFVRVLLNAFYTFFDNVAFLCRFNVLDICRIVDGRRCQLLSRRAQLAGYLCSLVFNLYELRDGLLRLEYDPPAAKRASVKAVVSAVRDVADVVVTATDLGLWRGALAPAETTTGALVCISGCLSTYLNWKKIK